MSIELKDFRGRITPETYCALEAISRANGKDHQEIVRAVMHEWALKQIHAASVMQGLLMAEGLSGTAAGIAGNVREPAGTRGKGRA